MKKIIIYSVITLFFGCHPVENVYYKIQNQSSVSVVIQGFKRFDSQGNRLSEMEISDLITLNSGESNSKKFYIEMGYLEAEGYFSVPFVDSINLVFNAEKFITLNCNGYIYNAPSEESCDLYSNGQTCEFCLNNLFTYFNLENTLVNISEEDYQSAIAIEN